MQIISDDCYSLARESAVYKRPAAIGKQVDTCDKIRQLIYQIFNVQTRALSTCISI